MRCGMGKSYIDDITPAPEFAFDPTLPVDVMIAAREAHLRYLELRRRLLAAPPPDGIGLDGRPLQRGKNNDNP